MFGRIQPPGCPRAGRFAMRAAHGVRWLWTTLTLGAAAVLLIATAAGARTSPRCESHRLHATLSTPRVIVWSVRREVDSTGTATVYYTCRRPGGAGHQLGIDGPYLGDYGPEQTLDGFSSGGTFVAARASRGYAAMVECNKYDPSYTGCGAVDYWIAVADATDGAHAKLYPAADGPAVLSPLGAAAWVSSGSLWASPLRRVGRSLRTSPVQLDISVQPTSIRFSGRTLRWISDGVAHQRVVG
jgi:hypothetical protein